MKTIIYSIFVGLLFLASVSANAFPKSTKGKKAKNKCIQSLEASPKDGELIIRVEEGIAAYITKYQKPPKKADLAAFTGMTKSDITKALRSVKLRLPDLVKAVVKKDPEVKSKLRQKLVKELTRFMKDTLTVPKIQNMANLAGLSVSDFRVLFGDGKRLLKDAALQPTNHSKTAQNTILKAIGVLAKQTNRPPSIDDIAEHLDVDTKRLLALVDSGYLGFTGLDAWIIEAKERKPGSFKHVMMPELYSRENQAEMMQAIRNRSRLIVISIISGARAEDPWFQSLLTYAKKMDAEILVIPANMEVGNLDKKLYETPGVHVVTNTIELSKDLRIDKLPLMPKMINPQTGLEGGMQDPENPNQSVILGHPQLTAKTYPTSTLDNARSPKVIYTTGSLNNPNNYQGEHEIQARTDEFAKNRHMMAGLVLEKTVGSNGLVQVQGKKIGAWHIREIQYIPEKNGFWDLGVFYPAKGRTQQERVDTAVVGDSHPGEDNQKIYGQILDKVVEVYNPINVVLHDIFNGHSISHHEMDKILTMAQKAKLGLLDLKLELRKLAAFLNAVHHRFPHLNIKIPPANHNHWLIRYLESGRFLNEPHNSEIGLKLATAMNRGENVFKYALEMFGLTRTEKIDFMGDLDEFTVGPPHRPVHLGYHGDIGNGGGRGGLASFGRALGGVVFNHTHTYARWGRAVNGGTTTDLIVPYNKKGLSNWVQMITLVGPNGELQSLRFTRDEFYSSPESLPRGPDDFFEQGYPYMVPNRTGGAYVRDQYSRLLDNRSDY